MKRLSIKSRSVLVSWLVSYFLILSLSVIGSSIIYVISTNIISSEVLYSHKIVLEQIQQLLDKRIEDIDRLATQIEMNENVQSVIYIREPMTNENHYRIGRTVNDLIVYRTANAFVDNFYIYLGNLKKVLTPNALYDTTLAYNVFHEKDSLSYSNWIKLINESHSKLFYPLKKRNNGRTTIAYIRSIPNLKIYKPAATLVMLIDENRFQQAINGINISNGINVFILDSNNIILSSNRPISVPEEISYNSLSSPNGQFECFIDDKKYMILFTTSNITHWKYVAMIPITVLNSKPIFIRVITFICLSLISLFGVLLSFKFSKRNYNPIDRIVKNLSNYFYTPNQ
ncbi:MAG: hypothetical protein GX201_10785 [Clostridiales bacterium]|nr:hypothetical protein [Clostridiales bacterium]